MANSIVPMNGHCNLPAAFAGWNKYPQFIIYRRDWSAARGKWDKTPISPKTGYACGSTDRTAWVTYEEAYAACIKFKMDGVGFCFSDTDPFWFLDLDHHFKDGVWSDRARELTALLSGAAIEISSSGDGLHIIGTGARPAHSSSNKAEGLELYSDGRFCALTFNHASGDVLCDRSEQITNVAARFFAPKSGGEGSADWTDVPVEEWAGPDDDEAIIKMALKRRSADATLGTKVSFKQIWEFDEDAFVKFFPDKSKEGSKGYDASAVDSALAFFLAYYTGKNCERMERIMRLSPLVRDKWDRRDYIERTITNACSTVKGVLQQRSRAKPPVLVVPPPPRPGHATDDLGATAMVVDKGNHLYIEMMVRAHCESLQYDEFKDAILLNGEPLTDNTERALLFEISAITSLKINKIFFGEVIRYMAYKNRFHPVRDYVDTAQGQWDGVDRCETWLIEAGGAADTPFNRAISRMFLVAAVRRVRNPGEKFDEMVVLEGPQGLLKSSLLKALPPNPKWFSDCLTMGMDTKHVMEALRGIWIAEAPEMSNMNKSEVEGVKAMLSRANDRARPAYGRNVEDVYRQCVFAGTVNNQKYLRDPTGNRRFWPIALTHEIDIDWVISVRDQLWAEAAVREAAGESIRLDPALYEAAAEEQMLRMIDDPYADVLSEKLGGLTGRIDSSVVWALLGVPIERRHGSQVKMGEAMKRNGWQAKQFRHGTDRRTKYWRGSWDNEITLDTIAAATALGADAPDNVVPLKEAGK